MIPVYLKPKPRVSHDDATARILWIRPAGAAKGPGIGAAGHCRDEDTGASRPCWATAPCASDLRQRISRLGLQDKVTWAGYAPEIESYLAQADALLITSRYEGGPAVAVEALAQGVPVVSTDCSFLLHDILTRPEAGRIVTSREPRALAAALAAVCRRATRRGSLQALAAPFEPQACARAYLDWLDGLVRHG